MAPQDHAAVGASRFAFARIAGATLSTGAVPQSLSAGDASEHTSTIPAMCIAEVEVPSS
jgi:hypothetical protein